MKRNFYFFRHGQTDWNDKRLCQGHRDIPLNETGVEQARGLIDIFQKIPSLDIIYSSDLKRAYQTAEILASHFKVEIKQTSLLRETNLGSLEGVEVEVAKEKLGEEIWSSFLDTDEKSLDIRFPHGESRREVRDRFMNVFNQILETDFESVGISTHGGAMRNFLHSLFPEQRKALEIPNCVVYKVSGNKELKDWNLEGPLF